MVNNGVDEIFNNEYFIREILLRVPAKQILKFKCVCKQWLSIISDLQFGYDHTSQNPNPPHLGLYFYNTVVPYTTVGYKTIPNDGISSLPPLDFLDNFNIVDTCGGLALGLQEHAKQKTYAICNPTTQKYSILPMVPGINITIWRVYERLAFDPAKSPHYKVIILYGTRYGADRIMIFLSEEGIWRMWPQHVVPGVPASGVIFSKGSLHWLTTNNVQFEFVVDTEELKSTTITQNPKIRRDNIRYFGECGGRLFLAMGGPLTYMCTIFEMESDTRLWNSKYRINFKDIICQRVGEGAKFYVLNIMKMSNHSDLTLMLATPGGFVSYNLESRILEVRNGFLPSEFGEIPMELTNLGRYSHRFTESLFPI